VVGGAVRLAGENLLALDEAAMRGLRGNRISMIFQEPKTSLNPVLTIGGQIEEAVRLHQDLSRSAAREKAVEMLRLVRIPEPARRARDYPHQLSGGMRQRAMIAMALSSHPQVLIADEPTTALDVTVQAQILDLLQDLQREFNSAVIIITHDLGVVAELADTTMVMYAGRAVEYGATREILTHPEMPYSWGLMGSVPDVSADADARLIPIPGNPPSLLNPPSGCAFHPRCAHVDKVPGNLCRTTLPELVPGERGENHLKRCHLANPGEIYAEEVLPEIAPDLVDPETGELIPELAEVDPDAV
jgi:peptide/nickel transport system ATP-binding protein